MGTVKNSEHPDEMRWHFISVCPVFLCQNRVLEKETHFKIITCYASIYTKYYPNFIIYSFMENSLV